MLYYAVSTVDNCYWFTILFRQKKTKKTNSSSFPSWRAYLIVNNLLDTKAVSANHCFRTTLIVTQTLDFSLPWFHFRAVLTYELRFRDQREKMHAHHKHRAHAAKSYQVKVVWQSRKSYAESKRKFKAKIKF